MRKMSDTEIDDEVVGIVTVSSVGAWTRIKFAAKILFLGEATFCLTADNFTEEGERPRQSDTTCILAATPEELMAPQNCEEARRMVALADDEHVCVGDPPDFGADGVEHAEIRSGE